MIARSDKLCTINAPSGIEFSRGIDLWNSIFDALEPTVQGINNEVWSIFRNVMSYKFQGLKIDSSDIHSYERDLCLIFSLKNEIYEMQSRKVFLKIP